MDYKTQIKMFKHLIPIGERFKRPYKLSQK